MRSQRTPNQANHTNDPWQARDHMNPPLGLARNTVHLNEYGKQVQREAARPDGSISVLKDKIFYSEQMQRTLRNEARIQMDIHQTTADLQEQQRAADALHARMKQLEQQLRNTQTLKRELAEQERIAREKINQHGRIRWF